MSHNPFNVPCVCGLQNAQNGHSDLSHKCGNGSTLPGSLSSKQAKPHINGMATPCPCQVRQMLLSNPSLVAHSVQVRELLGYSFPVLLMDGTNQTCARTRGVHSSPRRKILRHRRTVKHEPTIEYDKGGHIDSSYHPYLSRPEGNVLLAVMY